MMKSTHGDSETMELLEQANSNLEELLEKL